MTIWARLAVPAAEVYQWQIYEVYRLNDLIRTAKQRQDRVALTFNSDLDLQHTCFAEWSDAPYSEYSRDGKRRLGYMFGLMPSTLDGSSHLIHWSSRNTRRTVKRSLAGHTYALGEMVGHMKLVLAFYGQSSSHPRPFVRIEDYGSLSSHRYNK